MIADVDIGGVYVHPLLIAAVLAFAGTEMASWLLGRAGFYRFVWHRGLFDVAIVIVLWGGIAALITRGDIAAAFIG